MASFFHFFITYCVILEHNHLKSKWWLIRLDIYGALYLQCLKTESNNVVYIYELKTMMPQFHCNTMSKITSNASKQEKATVKAYPLFLEILLSGNQMDFSETRYVQLSYSSYRTTQSKCLLRSGQVKPTVWLTLSRTLVTCQSWTEQTQQHIHSERTQALSHPSDACTVSDNEEDKTHHINYPANTFFQSPVKDCAEAFLETYMKPTGVPRHSWVLNLGSHRIACQQPLLQGKKDEEKEYYVYACKCKKWGEGRGEAGALCE